MEPVATFSLVRFPGRTLPQLVAVPGRRRRLARAPGLVVGRWLGTATGSGTSTRADPARWAAFAVWEDDSARQQFLRSPLVASWEAAARAGPGAGAGGGARQSAGEVAHLELLPLTAHGRWGGIEPFPHLTGRSAPDAGGPVAVLTRARVRAARLRRFGHASAGVDVELAGAPGRLRSVGMGEWPMGWQATFSIWSGRSALHDFAYRSPVHRDVVGRTRDERWYGEELFARFSVQRTTGTWDGSTPLSPGDGGRAAGTPA